jgi:hypothetical protein
MLTLVGLYLITFFHEVAHFMIRFQNGHFFIDTREILKSKVAEAGNIMERLFLREEYY